MQLKIEKQIPLAQHTTLHVGGVADYFVRVRSLAELTEALWFAQQTATPPVIFGGGSNILVRDQGYRGLVIKNEIDGIHYGEVLGSKIAFTCGAGEELDDVVRQTVEKGYWGLENLSSIPGTIGATPIQNVGAYGVEVGTLIRSVSAVHIQTLEVKQFSAAECQFAYRDSFFKTEAGRLWVVTAVEFVLSVEPAPVLTYKDLQPLEEHVGLTQELIRSTVQNIRAQKFPDWSVVGTAGSFFKNPIISTAHYAELLQLYPELPGHPVESGEVKVNLGWILDKVCGLRGWCENGVCLYKHQALVLVNESAASANVIDEFADRVAETVFQKTKIKIEREVRVI